MNRICVEFKRYEKEGPNGELATTETPYYDYEVLLNGFVVKTFSGYDSRWSHVRKETEVRVEAFEYLHDLCNALEVPTPDMFGYMRVEKTVIWYGLDTK